MKKLFLLVSCVAALLVLSNMSFAAEGVVADPVVPCVCNNCDCSALPFAYPPQRLFGGKFAALSSKCVLGHRAPQACPFTPAPQCFAPPCPEALPAACPYPYPYPYSNAYLRAVRRAAKLAPQPFQPCPLPVPGAVAPPVVAPQPVAFAAPPAMPAFAASVGQTGYKNTVSQRAPVINFLSVVRAPRTPYDPYAGYYPAAPTCPCQAEAQ